MKRKRREGGRRDWRKLKQSNALNSVPRPTRYWCVNVADFPWPSSCFIYSIRITIAPQFCRSSATLSVIWQCIPSYERCCAPTATMSRWKYRSMVNTFQYIRRNTAGNQFMQDKSVRTSFNFINKRMHSLGNIAFNNIIRLLVQFQFQFHWLPT